MRRPRHEIEAQIPPRQDQEHAKGAQKGSRPQIRRQLERLCEKLGLEYDDVFELHIIPGEIQYAAYDRNEAGAHYRDEADRPAVKRDRIFVDTTTFLGDERDI